VIADFNIIQGLPAVLKSFLIRVKLSAGNPIATFN
jgi:hypothetical protein